MSGSTREPAADEPFEVLPPETEAELIRALEAAVRPPDIRPERHEAILAACLEDPLAPPTRAEQEAAEALARGLEGESDHDDVKLARALAHAHAAASPGNPAPEAGTAPVESALRRALPQKAERSSVVYAVFGAAASALAVAAAIALWLLPVARVRDEAPMAAAVDAAELKSSRSLSPLFADGAQGLDASARIDRIASERARELRDNRYLAWGVR